MKDPVENGTPPSRKRRRWLIIGGIVLLLIVGWRFQTRNTLIARARLIKVGQTRHEVEKILGQARRGSGSSNGTSADFYIEKTSLELFLRAQIETHLHVRAYPDVEEYPVRIGYDVNRRVSDVRIHE